MKEVMEYLHRQTDIALGIVEERVVPVNQMQLLLQRKQQQSRSLGHHTHNYWMVNSEGKSGRKMGRQLKNVILHERNV